MRTPTNAAITTLLNSGAPFVKADCYTMTLLNGTVFRFCDQSINVTVGGYTFAGTGVKISRNALKQSVGVEVDTLTLFLQATSTDLINGFPWYQAMLMGALDGAQVDLDIAFASAPGVNGAAPSWLGTVNWFSGYVGDIGNVSRTGCSIDIKGDSERLDIMMPRNLFQPSCTNTLYDSACTVLRSTYTGYAYVNADTYTAGNPSIFATNISAGSVGYYDLGYVKIFGGAYDGMSKTVKWSNVSPSGNLVLWFFEPWPIVIPAGQEFQVSPGCDKAYTTCKNKFNNVIHFRGTDQIPAPEVVA